MLALWDIIRNSGNCMLALWDIIRNSGNCMLALWDVIRNSGNCMLALWVMTARHIPEGRNSQLQRCENFKTRDGTCLLRGTI
jgi:hypothetical protein